MFDTISVASTDEEGLYWSIKIHVLESQSHNPKSVQDYDLVVLNSLITLQSSLDNFVTI